MPPVLNIALARALWRDTRGAAAVEFALVAGMLTFGVLNAIDIGRYAFTRMEVENAAEMGAQAAWKTCNLYSLPATKNCPGFASSVTAAVQGTSLGTAVTLPTGSPAEGYYCVDAAANSLRFVADVTTKPADCSAVGDASVQPGDYVEVRVTCSYSPLFPGISAIGALGIGTIAATSWMRLG